MLYALQGWGSILGSGVGISLFGITFRTGSFSFLSELEDRSREIRDSRSVKLLILRVTHFVLSIRWVELYEIAEVTKLRNFRKEEYRGCMSIMITSSVAKSV
jgi:hypothetical protein